MQSIRQGLTAVLSTLLFVVPAVAGSLSAPHPVGWASSSDAQPSGRNVALGKPASSTGSDGVASRGNDGDPSTLWKVGANEACWTVDLEGEFVISAITVKSSQFGSGGLKTVFQVSGSLDQGNWTPIGAAYTATGDHAFTIAANGARVRFIRYCTVAGSINSATLGELEAVGTAAH
jgi:hypothetical protein